jgi:hypothetical protein
VRHAVLVEDDRAAARERPRRAKVNPGRGDNRARDGLRDDWVAAERVGERRRGSDRASGRCSVRVPTSVSVAVGGSNVCDETHNIEEPTTAPLSDRSRVSARNSGHAGVGPRKTGLSTRTVIGSR